MRAAFCVVLCLGCSSERARSEPAPITPPASAGLRSPSSFSTIADRAARSRAIFEEAGRVLGHPRCLNCHPADDAPRQRGGEMHEPPVARGPGDRGLPALECTSCHQSENGVLNRVPGAPTWHVAPRAMAWRDRSLAQICEQLKDPKRNGGRTLAQVVEHAAQDRLVAWGWAPGADREPAPGTQAAFGALMAAWVESGAACPESETRK